MVTKYHIYIFLASQYWWSYLKYLVKVKYSEKASKVWVNLPFYFDVTYYVLSDVIKTWKIDLKFVVFAQYLNFKNSASTWNIGATSKHISSHWALAWALNITYLSRFLDCLAHPNLSPTLATDQKWPLSCLCISYQILAECHLP